MHLLVVWLASAVARELARTHRLPCGNVRTQCSTEGVVLMARPGPQTQAKRRREQAKKEKRRAKEEKKALRKAEKEANT